mgnify:FL=1
MKKIMFNDRYGLTQAVLEGRKTQTRRIVYTQNGFVVFDGEDFQLKKLDNGQALLTLCNNRFKTAYYKIGETIAIAQSYKTIQEYLRKVTGTDLELKSELSQSKGYTNKIFVRADHMPHHIRITNIRFERLQDISEKDCLAEGIWEAHDVGLEGVTYWYTGLANSPYRTAREAYAALIDKINGKGTWQSNPYVFVYNFETVSLPNT